MTKHRMIFESVQQRIRSGDFQPGDRIPSDSELVHEFNVSRPTVARALQELERKGLVIRRPGSGTYVHRIESTGSMFGLLIPGLGQTEIFEPICGEIARAAQQHHHALLWGGTGGRSHSDENQADLARELCRQYIQKRVSGVFFAPLELNRNKDQVNREVISALSSARIAVVLLDRDYLPYPQRSNYDLIGIDNHRAGMLITNHMLEQGCQRVAFICRPNSASTIDMRIAGYREAIWNAGKKLDPQLCFNCDPRDVAAIRTFFDQKQPDAVICGNDVTAANLMHSLEEIGIAVPEDVLVGGIDDVRYAELLRVPLTTVHQPCDAIAHRALQAMLARLENPEEPAYDIRLNAHLVVRASSVRQAVTA